MGEAFGLLTPTEDLVTLLQRFSLVMLGLGLFLYFERRLYSMPELRYDAGALTN